jgi:hypothetical protein
MVLTASVAVVCDCGLKTDGKVVLFVFPFDCAVVADAAATG